MNINECIEHLTQVSNILAKQRDGEELSDLEITIARLNIDYVNNELKQWEDRL